MTTAHAFGGRTHEFGIADRLRVARESTGLDQREFAERTGLSRATISNYERGITKPKWPQIVVWSIATDFDPGWLQDGRKAGGESGPGGPKGESLPRVDSDHQPAGYLGRGLQLAA